MKTNRLDHMSRFPAAAALTALTIGALVLAGNTDAAESTVQPKSTHVERAKIEKTISPTVDSKFSTMATTLAVDPYDRYIIALTDASVARYRGGVNNYQATSTQGKSKLDVRSAEAVAYSQYLATTQEKLLANMARQLGRNIEPLSQLQVASNVIIVELSADEALKVAQLSGVRLVVKDKLHKLEKTETYNGYAMDTDRASSMTATVVAVTLFALLALAWFAYRRGWLGRKSAVLAAIASTLGMAGCYYEGGFEWIGAPELWHGARDLKPTMGEGVIVGILDTGINPISDSFAAVSGDGYRHTNPKDKYLGVCDPSEELFDESFPCNDKLIGAWGYSYIHDGSARDIDGHGSHTAGTTAGNIVYNATVKAPTGFEITKAIAGVSPHSNIIAYKVCIETGCYDSAILSSINQAIIDGVDVINHSIGGESVDPWGEPVALGFLSAMDAGIFVATSAGNSGPDKATVGRPADSPWVTSVAASSHNLFYENSLVGLVNDQGETLDDITGQSITPGFGPAEIVDATDYGNPLCLADQFTSKFEGQIVLCDAGVIERVKKGVNVAANGGSALILARPPLAELDGPGYLEADTHEIPATHITYIDATALRAWLANGTGHQGSISGTTTVLTDEYADIIAYFSSRGMNPSVPSIIKPNVTAPGRAVFAAYYEDYSDAEQDYNIIQGTSMSSPHVAGSGALLTALHPDWTPMQIQSALMTTANLSLTRKEDGVTQADPFDVGAGRVDLPLAARAALLLDEDLEGFQAADPLLGGDPSALNLASLGEGVCVVDCSWTRTVTNVSDHRMTWRAEPTELVTVEPAEFSLDAGESIELTFAADVAGIDIGEWLLDQVKLFPSKDYGSDLNATNRHHGGLRKPFVPSVHFPVAARSMFGEVPAMIEIEAGAESDTVNLTGLKAVEITDATVELSGLAQSTVYEGALVSDPTNGDAFDGGFDPEKDGQQVFIIDVPEGAKRLVAEISESGSGDLDLFIGTGDKPGYGTLLYSSATFTALEYKNVEAPKAGTYWVVVQNWEAGHVEPQPFKLHIGIVEGDTGNFSVEVPYTQPAGEPFDATIGFQLPGSVSGDRFYGAFSLGTDSANAGNIGTVMVDLVRQ